MKTKLDTLITANKDAQAKTSGDDATKTKLKTSHDQAVLDFMINDLIGAYLVDASNKLTYLDNKDGKFGDYKTNKNLVKLSSNDGLLQRLKSWTVGMFPALPEASAWAIATNFYTWATVIGGGL